MPEKGIVYGEQKMKSLRVRSVKALDDMIMLLTFSNGETRLFDATVLNGPAYEKLKTDQVFKNPNVDHGVVTWLDGEIDCAPEYMYQNSYEYEKLAM
ncbi:MAG: DUF2442 domain-containing protein [Clostridiales bacterium]|nr:DUF2442 domain-containing protein [Clostridiales bacterium]